jgi:undecaprenyl pyrophosphate phosphatase UppP
MTPETSPKRDTDPLRDRLLGQWEPRQTSYLTYRKEIETMLENQEKKLRREKRFTTVMWIYIVALTTILLTGSGLLMIHKIEGTWMAVTAVFWFLFGTVFLLSHLINQRNFELVKEIKGVELRLASLEERLAARGDITGTPE